MSVFLLSKRGWMDGGDFYHYLIPCTCKDMHVGASQKLMQEVDIMKVVFPVRKSVTTRGLLVVHLMVCVSCVQAITVLPVKEKLVIPLLFFLFIPWL